MWKKYESKITHKVHIQSDAVFLACYDSNNCWIGLKIDAEKLLEAPIPAGWEKGGDFKAIGSSKFEKIIHAFCEKNPSFKLLKYVTRDACEIHFDGATGKLQVEKQEPAFQVDAKPAIGLKKSGPLKVMIVDDSKTIRQILRKIFSQDPSVEVVADFEDPAKALEEVEKINPDVITLDIHMPNIDGVEFLKRLMPRKRIPTIMISSISIAEGPMVLNALEAGAVDYIQKPSFDQIGVVAPMILEKVKISASANLTSRAKPQREENLSSFVSTGFDMNKIIAIGSSTGGTEALKEVLTRLPAEIPPVLVVQHIPAVFSKAFAERMNGLCKCRVKEATDGESIKSGWVYIAPGGFQMSVVKSSNAEAKIKIEDSEPVNRHKPSVDVMMNAVAKIWGRKAVGLILTGMGNDGAKGLLEMKNAGASTFNQDEDTSVVYGMPKAAWQLGASDKEVPLLSIPKEILSRLSAKKAA